MVHHPPVVRPARTVLCCALMAITLWHPHGKLPLWTYTVRARDWLDSKPGVAAKAVVEARILAALGGSSAGLPPGAITKTVRDWAGRGQVDLVQHVLALMADQPLAPDLLVAHLRSCLICRVLVRDARHGDPDPVAKLPRGKNGILPITAHAFLTIPRPGLVVPKAGAPADEAFLLALTKRDHAVARHIGYERLDVDGDGWPETERLDIDDDGTFEVYHVDRDGDGAFESEARREKDGTWKIAPHQELLDEAGRLRAASRPAVDSEPSRRGDDHDHD